MLHLIKKCRRHKRIEKIVHLLGIVALLALVGHHAKCLLHSMRRKKRNPMQEKMEHFQHCFERLMEHR